MAFSLLKSVSQKPVADMRQRDGVHHVIRGIVARQEDGLVAISPGLAAQIIAETNWQGQRKVSEKRKREHLGNITSGRWVPQMSEIAFAETPDMLLYLINGQHRLSAIHASGRCVKTRVQIIAASDMADVGRLYAMFDSPDQARNDNEMLVGAGVASTLGLKQRTARALFSALSIIRNDMEPAGPRSETVDARSRSGRLESLADWADEAKLYEQIISVADKHISQKMHGQGAMASGLCLLRHQPAKALQFLSGIAENDGLRKYDPRARLIADFHQRSLNTGSIRQSVQQIAAAWNAFYEGRDLKIIKCIEDGPITFRGTTKGGKR